MSARQQSTYCVTAAADSNITALSQVELKMKREQKTKKKEPENERRCRDFDIVFEIEYRMLIECSTTAIFW